MPGHSLIRSDQLRSIQRLDQVVDYVDARLLEAKLVSPQDPIVILMGDPIHDKPLTNLMRVHRVRRAKEPAAAPAAPRRGARRRGK